MVTLVSKMHVMSSNSFTFHVAFSLEHDERVTSATAVLVSYDSHPFNAAKALELPPKVVLSRVFVLSKQSDVCWTGEKMSTYQT